MSSLYLIDNFTSIYHNAYYFLFKMLKNHYYKEIQNEMKESLKWKFIPLINDKVKMIHKETQKQEETLCMFFGIYDKISKRFIWRNNILKNIIKKFILDNYNLKHHLGVGNCFIKAIFSYSIHIREEDHIIIPTFIRMFYRDFRLIRVVNSDDNDKLIYYTLVRYNFRDDTKFDSFMDELTLYKNLLMIFMDPIISVYNQDEENNKNIQNTIDADYSNYYAINEL